MSSYAMFGHDNDTHFFRDRADVQRCNDCGQLLDKWSESLTGVRLGDETMDVSCSYDGVFVVSSRFKAVYDICCLSGLEFRPLYEDFFFILPTNMVLFDVDKRGTKFVDFCATCGLYKSVAGATPVFLSPGETIPHLGFARTDVEFGSGDGKCPLYLCGAGAGECLRDVGLRGIELLDVP